MKIALVISCLNSKSQGNGGHYYSLMETASQLSKQHEIIIISIGNKFPKAFNSINNKLYHCNYHFNTLKTLNIFKQIIEYESIDIMHSFDEICHLWVRILSRKLNIPCCLTKCGGKNPRYYPYVDNLIVFSKENEVYFKNQIKFSSSQIYLIPNRLRKFSSDAERIENINKSLSIRADTCKFLRISRIGDYYHKSSLQLINLVKRLNEDHIKSVVIFIGTIENQKCLDELRALSEDNVFFINEYNYTKNSKELIDISDIVLGTGRSFMEASSKGKILLVPHIHEDIPVLVTTNNFEDAFYYNFSERINFKNYDKEANYKHLKTLIKNKEKQEEAKLFSLQLFDTYFDSSLILKKLNIIYNSLKISKLKRLDLVLHTLFVLRKSILK